IGVSLLSNTRSPGSRSSSNTRPPGSGGTITRTTGSSSSRSRPISPVGLAMTTPAYLLRGHHELDHLTTVGAASSRSVATDQAQDGLKVASIESVTLSDGEARRARTLPPGAGLRPGALQALGPRD